MMLKALVVPAVTVSTLLFSTAIPAQDAAIERGRAFAQANCARCHAIGPVGDSLLPKAPPFRALHQRYPVENLVEALAEGIRTAHPAMPAFELDQRQIDDLIAYLKSLERSHGAGRPATARSVRRPRRGRVGADRGPRCDSNGACHHRGPTFIPTR